MMIDYNDDRWLLWWLLCVCYDGYDYVVRRIRKTMMMMIMVMYVCICSISISIAILITAYNDL